MRAELDLCHPFLEQHPEQAARVLERLTAADAAALLDRVATPAAAGVLERMASSAAADCLARMAPDAAAPAVAALRTDAAARLLRQVDETTQRAVLDALPDEDAGILRTALRYPPGTAGALMDPRVAAVAEDGTAGEALTRLRRSPRHLFYYVYAVDREGRLTGVIDLGELMLAPARAPLAGLVHRAVDRLAVHMARPAILAHPAWRHVHALPVVDDGQTLVGVIRYPVFRRLEDESRQVRGTDATAAVVALGELYWVGLSGVLEALASAVKRARPGDEEGNHGRA